MSLGVLPRSQQRGVSFIQAPAREWEIDAGDRDRAAFLLLAAKLGWVWRIVRAG